MGSTTVVTILTGVYTSIGSLLTTVLPSAFALLVSVGVLFLVWRAISRKLAGGGRVHL